MDDLEQRLARLGQVPIPVVSESQVRADLERARSARRARRTRRASIAGLALVGAAGAAVVAVTAGRPDVPAPPTTTHLVAYTGTQEAGFTVTRVPAGYVLQGASRGILAIARADDHTSIDSFAHKIVVTVSKASEYPPPEGTRVVVSGHVGAIATSNDGVTTLEWIEGRRLVQVQEWSDIGLSRDELVAFADGITVTSAATNSHG